MMEMKASAYTVRFDQWYGELQDMFRRLDANGKTYVTRAEEHDFTHTASSSTPYDKRGFCNLDGQDYQTIRELIGDGLELLETAERDRSPCPKTVIDIADLAKAYSGVLHGVMYLADISRYDDRATAAEQIFSNHHIENLPERIADTVLGHFPDIECSLFGMKPRGTEIWTNADRTQVSMKLVTTRGYEWSTLSVPDTRPVEKELVAGGQDEPRGDEDKLTSLYKKVAASPHGSHLTEFVKLVGQLVSTRPDVIRKHATDIMEMQGVLSQMYMCQEPDFYGDKSKTFMEFRGVADQLNQLLSTPAAQINGTGP